MNNFKVGQQVEWVSGVKMVITAKHANNNFDIYYAGKTVPKNLGPTYLDRPCDELVEMGDKVIWNHE